VIIFVLVECMVVSAVCMCSYVTGGYVCGMVHQFFWLFVWCTLEMFRRCYYVTLLCVSVYGMFFVLGVGALLVCV